MIEHEVSKDLGHLQPHPHPINIYGYANYLKVLSCVFLEKHNEPNQMTRAPTGPRKFCLIPCVWTNEFVGVTYRET